MIQNLVAKVWLFSCFVFVMASAMPDVCKLPSETGMCRAAIKLWFFNVDTGNCENFIWGGCGGNENRFESKASCEAKCN